MTQPVLLSDYRPPAFLVDTVDLSFDLHPTATKVVSRLAVRRNPNAGENEPLRFNGEALTLVRIARDGVELPAGSWTVEGGCLTIAAMPDACILEIETKTAPAENTELSGLYLSGGNYFTQCEAEGFRRITFFPDRPDVMSRYTVTIAADKTAVPAMLSNGNPGAVTDHGDGRHRVIWIDPHPKPCYLFALVAGDLVSVKDRFTTRSGRPVDLGIYVRRGDEDKCAHAMRSLIESMRWDEDVFGLEYDLDVFNIAAVSDFNMGAMENKGLNVFNTKYVLAKPDTATDNDYQGIEAVIAHEYFHNWTGNRVTCRDWFQLSLKEGLTVYRDQEFSADQGSRAVKRIGDVRGLRAAQFREDSGPLAHPVQPKSYLAIDNFYTSTVYNKGAEVIRMMATIIGRDAFRKGMDLYFQRHDNNAVTIEEFVAAMADASGVNMDKFRAWYDQAGTPHVSIDDSYDAAAKRYRLTIRQNTKPTPGQPDKQPLVLPVAMGLLDGNGQELETKLAGESTFVTGTRVLLATEAETTFTFEDVASPPVPSLFRGFSAPIKLSGISPERARFLAAHDTDPFVRWDSGQQFATRVLLDMIAAGPSASVDPALIEALSETLALADNDPAFAAEAMILPGEAFLADQMPVADVDAIHIAREAARTAIGAALRDRLLAVYGHFASHGPYSIDGAAIGARSIRNVCLAYLSAGGEPGMAKRQFDTAGNMTDSLAALSVLAGIDCPERVAALASFHAKWKDDPLVLDKWFSIQATSPLRDAIAHVRSLAAHPDFDLKNPNRIRSLVGAFAGANQVRFHDRTGAGYRFLANIVIQLDPSNPQVAARIVGPLGQWRRMDAGRQDLMKIELRRILALSGLSTNTFEMVSKSLD